MSVCEFHELYILKYFNYFYMLFIYFLIIIFYSLKLLPIDEIVMILLYTQNGNNNNEEGRIIIRKQKKKNHYLTIFQTPYSPVFVQYKYFPKYLTYICETLNICS